MLERWMDWKQADAGEIDGLETGWCWRDWWTKIGWCWRDCWDWNRLMLETGGLKQTDAREMDWNRLMLKWMDWNRLMLKRCMDWNRLMLKQADAEEVHGLKQGDAGEIVETETGRCWRDCWDCNRLMLERLLRLKQADGWEEIEK